MENIDIKVNWSLAIAIIALLFTIYQFVSSQIKEKQEKTKHRSHTISIVANFSYSIAEVWLKEYFKKTKRLDPMMLDIEMQILKLQATCNQMKLNINIAEVLKKDIYESIRLFNFRPPAIVRDRIIEVTNPELSEIIGLVYDGAAYLSFLQWAPDHIGAKSNDEPGKQVSRMINPDEYRKSRIYESYASYFNSTSDKLNIDVHLPLEPPPTMHEYSEIIQNAIGIYFSSISTL